MVRVGELGISGHSGGVLVKTYLGAVVEGHSGPSFMMAYL